MSNQVIDTALGENAEEDLASSPIFLTSLKERYCFNPESEKKTYHIVLDLQGSSCVYNVGDCIGIYPQNDPHLIEKILTILRLSGEEKVLNRQKETVTLHHFLLNQVNLNRIPQKLGGQNLIEFLKNNSLLLQELCDAFLPMLPRFYSIASSMSVVEKEAHLTVALTNNEPESFSPFGTCSYFLCCRAPLNEVCLPIFHQPTKHFFLPPDSFDKPVIMIGPGTGVAPFRGFMQERLFRNGSSENWLFFGERYSKTDFYYKEFWQNLESRKSLKLSCAFSRDQSDKVYVQHKMMENSKDLWQWLEKGAYIYVCGDAKNMAKDVDKTLHLIAEKEGKLDPTGAKEYIRNLKKQGRYQRDVY